MLEIGRVCIKTSGRDAMQYGVIVEKIDENFVVLDGQVRRRKVNIQHIEPLMKTVDIKAKADTKTVIKALEGVGIVVQPRVENKKVNTTPRPQKVKKTSSKEESKK